MSEKYFHCLRNLPNLSANFVEQGVDISKYTIRMTPNLYECKVFGWYNTDFFKQTEAHFGQKFSAGFYLNPPNSYYKWHTDVQRHCALNWLVKTNPKGGAFYKEPIPELAPPDRSPHFFNLLEVEYELLKPTLINTDESHCVINNYNDYRIIFSMALSDVTYKDALAYFKDLTISSY